MEVVGKINGIIKTYYEKKIMESLKLLRKK